MKKANKNIFKGVITVIVILLLSAASWRFYSLYNDGMTKLLEYFGIMNANLQGIIIIAMALIVAVLLGGYHLIKAIKKILGV